MISPAQVIDTTSFEEPEIHPIQRLGPYLLAEIFTHCLPDHFDMIMNRRPGRFIVAQPAPILISNVCSSWRSLAFSTPRLWQTFFFFSPDVPASTRINSLPNHIHTWLGRSGTLPLTIYFFLYTQSASIVTDSVKVLLEYSSRWERVLIQTSPLISWPHSVSLTPNLREFRSNISSLMDASGFPFHSAPILKRLSLSVMIHAPSSVSSIPWIQLTELCIDEPVALSTTVELLRGCPVLDKLSLGVQDFENYHGARLIPLGSIKHEVLRWLRLYISEPSAAVLVENLTLTKLKELTIVDMGAMGDPYCYSQFLDLFTRSKCKLQTLNLERSSFKPYQLLEYMKHPSSQTLTCLHIGGHDFGENGLIPIVDNQVLSQLTYSNERDTAPLCPKLSELILNCCYRSEDSPSGDSLGRMVQSRCFGRAPDEQLKSLDLTTWHPIWSEDNKLLDLSRDKGGLALSNRYKRRRTITGEVSA